MIPYSTYNEAYLMNYNSDPLKSKAKGANYNMWTSILSQVYESVGQVNKMLISGTRHTRKRIVKQIGAYIAVSPIP